MTEYVHLEDFGANKWEVKRWRGGETMFAEPAAQNNHYRVRNDYGDKRMRVARRAPTRVRPRAVGVVTALADLPGAFGPN